MQPFGGHDSITIERRKEQVTNGTLGASVSKKDLIEKYFNMVYKLALSQVKSMTAADDVTQEVFLRYIKCEKDFEGEEHLKAWLIRVTLNCSKSTFTSSWFKKTVPLSEEESIPFEMQEKGDVYYAVLELPPKYKTVIHLFYYEDLSVAQIAKYLGMKESTIKSQLHRGREMLKEKLKGGVEDF